MSKKTVFSFTKGYTFTFEDEGNTIEVWFSGLSGLERVYVNGELVCSQRNLSTDSTNSFSIGGNDYSTTLTAVSLLKGPFVCTLSKNGKAYMRQKLTFTKANSSSKKLSYVLLFSFYIFASALFEFIRSYWQLPKESIYVFAPLLIFIVIAYQLKNGKGKKFVIENDEII